MNPDDHHDRLVDLLLWEHVGKESPPDVRARVLEAAAGQPHAPAAWQKPAVPPLSARTAKSMVPAFAIAAILTLLAVAGLLMQFQRISAARTPVLTAVSGTTSPPAGSIRPGESLSTGTHSSAVLTYQDGSVVNLSPETTIVVTKRPPWDPSKAIEIVAGKVQADVAVQPSGRPFVLNTEHALAEVVGTKLSIHRNDERTRLEVTEGAVNFIPHKTGGAVTVKSGFFAESGPSGFRHEKFPVPGITRFTLMNAETDQPIRDEPLVDGETISLASLPTRKINIRADYEGDPPTTVKIDLTRRDGASTGLPSHASEPHQYPPFFVAGDFWADGRPDDCQAWTPLPGLYRLSARTDYGKGINVTAPALNIKFRITE